jgi:hypothetical protein
MTDEWRARCREIWHGGFGEGSGETCLAPGKPKRSANATRSAPTLHKCESRPSSVLSKGSQLTVAEWSSWGIYWML